MKRRVFRLLATATTIALVAGCASYNTPIQTGPAPPVTSEQLAAQALARAAGVAADYNKGWKAAPEIEAEIARRDRGEPTRPIVTEADRAIADCQYRSSTAYWMAPRGVIHGAFASFATAAACQDYYRQVGVLN